jgi:hypothetical protein
VAQTRTKQDADAVCDYVGLLLTDLETNIKSGRKEKEKEKKRKKKKKES